MNRELPHSGLEPAPPWFSLCNHVLSPRPPATPLCMSGGICSEPVTVLVLPCTSSVCVRERLNDEPELVPAVVQCLGNLNLTSQDLMAEVLLMGHTHTRTHTHQMASLLMPSVSGARDSSGGSPVSECGRHPSSDAVHHSEHTDKGHAFCEYTGGIVEYCFPLCHSVILHCTEVSFTQ